MNTEGHVSIMKNLFIREIAYIGYCRGEKRRANSMADTNVQNTDSIIDITHTSQNNNAYKPLRINTCVA